MRHALKSRFKVSHIKVRSVIAVSRSMEVPAVVGQGVEDDADICREMRTEKDENNRKHNRNHKQGYKQI